MAPKPADKQRVYLAGRAVFVGSKANIRQLKKVRKVVGENRAVLRPLIRDLGEDKVVEAIRDLLERRIFESELQAKLAFPELFRSSPGEETRREASEIDAARSAAEAIDEETSMEDTEVEDTEVEEDEPVEAAVVNGNDGEVSRRAHPIPGPCDRPRLASFVGTAESSNHGRPALLPSLYPIYIPYRAQHLILNEAQRLLEESCFEFLQKWLPSVVEENGWECASSLELTKSTKLIARHSREIPEGAFVDPGKRPLEQILSTTNMLRHSAVHRLPNTARVIRDLCRSGVTLAATLGDLVRAAQLEDICNELDSKIETMKLTKNALEGAATAGLDEIRRQREELDRREKEIVARMVKEDGENKSFMGMLLEDSLSRILNERRLADIDEPIGGEHEESEDEKGKQIEGDERGTEEKTRDLSDAVPSWNPAWRVD